MVHAMCLLAEHIDNNTPVEEKMQVFFFVLFKRQYGNIVSMLYQSANAALMRCKYRRAQYEKMHWQRLSVRRRFIPAGVKHDAAGYLGGKNPDGHEDAAR